MGVNVGRFDMRRVGGGRGNRKTPRGEGWPVASSGRWRRIWLGVGAVVTLCVMPVEGGAQSPIAAPLLEADHWAVDALRRLEGLGAVSPVYTRGGPSPTAAEALRLFQAVKESEDPVAARLARGYAARLEAELPGVAAGQGEEGPFRDRIAGMTGAVFADRAGDVLTGVGYDNETDWTGTRPVEDHRRAALAFGWSAMPHPALAVEAALDWGEDGVEVRHGQVVVVGKGVGVWAGRRSVDYGGGSGGGVVLTSTSFDGGGLFLASPVRLPGFLGRLGPVRFETFLSEVENGDRVRDPWFWAMRGVMEPHPRLSLGATRGFMFGGEGNTPMTARTLAYMLIGKHSGEQGEYDNQVVSFDVHYRPPLGVLPLRLFLEWGMDDSAGAWHDVPAVVVGADVAAVPGLPNVSLGIERAWIAGSCCGNPMWYRNWALRGGWTDGGRPIGHPVAGHGDEWSGRIRAEFLDARVLLDVRGFTRERGEENLFAPERVGDSRGASFRVNMLTRRSLEFMAGGLVEQGRRDWRRSSLDAGLRMRF